MPQTGSAGIQGEYFIYYDVANTDRRVIGGVDTGTSGPAPQAVDNVGSAWRWVPEGGGNWVEQSGSSTTYSVSRPGVNGKAFLWPDGSGGQRTVTGDLDDVGNVSNLSGFEETSSDDQWVSLDWDSPEIKSFLPQSWKVYRREATNELPKPDWNLIATTSSTSHEDYTVSPNTEYEYSVIETVTQSTGTDVDGLRSSTAYINTGDEPQQFSITVTATETTTDDVFDCTAGVTGGTSPYDFSWVALRDGNEVLNVNWDPNRSVQSPTATINAFEPQTYELECTVTDANGLVRTASAFVQAG